MHMFNCWGVDAMLALIWRCSIALSLEPQLKLFHPNLKAYEAIEEEGLEILCGFESCKNSRTPSILGHRPAQTTRGIGPRCHLTAKTAQIDTKLFWVVKIGPQHAHNMQAQHGKPSCPTIQQRLSSPHCACVCENSRPQRSSCTCFRIFIGFSAQKQLEGGTCLQLFRIL